MRSIEPLATPVSDVFDRCVKGMRDSDRKTRILEAKKKVVSSDSVISLAGPLGLLHSVTPVKFSAKTKRDLAWFYEQRLVKSMPGRKIYDEILSIGRGGCPLCHSGKVATLDHSFPKSKHPFLAVSPANLVPACLDCNISKGVGAGRVTLSPYFDAWLEDVRWLYAYVPNISAPSDLIFEPRRHSSWSDAQWSLVEGYFSESGLGSRYTDLAIPEYSVVASAVRRNLGGGLQAINSLLDDRITDYMEVGLNTWHVAASEAWRSVAWSIRWKPRPGVV